MGVLVVLYMGESNSISAEAERINQIMDFVNNMVERLEPLESVSFIETDSDFMESGVVETNSPPTLYSRITVSIKTGVAGSQFINDV